MLKEDYLRCIKFLRLKRKMTREGYTTVTLERAMGKRISGSTISNSINGRFIMRTSSLVCLAAFFRCSVDLLVNFIGYDVDDERPLQVKIDEFVPREPDPDWHISYEPLYNMFKKKYGDNYKKEMNLFFDKIENIGMTERQKSNIQSLVEKNRLRYLELDAKGLIKHSGHRIESNIGLSINHRMKIHNDLDLPLPILYNICKELHCTPGEVVTYR